MVIDRQTGEPVGRIDLPYHTAFMFLEKGKYKYVPFDRSGDNPEVTDEDYKEYYKLPVFTEIKEVDI